MIQYRNTSCYCNMWNGSKCATLCIIIISHIAMYPTLLPCIAVFTCLYIIIISQCSVLQCIIPYHIISYHIISHSLIVQHRITCISYNFIIFHFTPDSMNADSLDHNQSAKSATDWPYRSHPPDSMLMAICQSASGPVQIIPNPSSPRAAAAFMQDVAVT